MNEINKQPELRRMPQPAEETGIATDYFNVFTFFKELELLQYGFSEEQIKQGIADHVKRFSPLKHYTERYLPQNFSEPVITENNKDNVKRLDEIIDYINANYSDPNNFTFEEANKLSEEISLLIFGSK